VDKVFDWAVVWGERRKAAAAEQTTPTKGNGFDSSGCKYKIDEIEQMVREGAPAGTNRSDIFHTIIGHYVGVGWNIDRIFEHLTKYPDGIGSRYLAQNRLRQEIERSAGKFEKSELPLFDSFEAKAPRRPSQSRPGRNKPSRIPSWMMILVVTMISSMMKN